MADVDYIEVGRQAHRLSSTHGREAWKFAARWAADAEREGRSEEAAFRKAVAASLEPR
jgi:hypothetical protein